MIAFYAWTDTLVLNALKIKQSDYPDTDADLIILNLPRVSRQIVEKIEEADVFRRILRIEDIHRRKRNAIQKAFKLLCGKQFYRALSAQLKDIESQEYDTLFTGGLWADSLFVYRFLANAKPSIQLMLMEEGVVNYGGARTAYWCDAINRKRDFLLRTLFYGKTYRKARKAISGVYLSEPEACLEKGTLELKKIRSDQPLLRELMKPLCDEQTIQAYMHRRVVFFMQPESQAHGEVTLEIVKALSERFGAQQVIVRAHPDTKSVQLLETACPGVYIDRCETTFEVLAGQIDWSDKVLAARASSCMFLPKFVLNQEPVLLFVYMLFDSGDRSLITPMTEKMRALYRWSDRVHVPRQIEEIRQIVSAISDTKTEEG